MTVLLPDAGDDVSDGLLCLPLEKFICHVVVHVVLQLAGGVNDGGQSNLTGAVDEDGIGEVNMAQERVYLRPPTVHIKTVSGLHINQQALQCPVRIVDGEVKLEFLHQEQLVVQDGTCGFLLVALQVMRRYFQIMRKTEMFYLPGCLTRTAAWRR